MFLARLRPTTRRAARFCVLTCVSAALLSVAAHTSGRAAFGGGARSSLSSSGPGCLGGARALSFPSALALLAGALEPAQSQVNAANGKIAFSQLGFDDSGLYVMNADGSSRVRINLDGDNPAWSPDGTKIAFSSYQGPGNGFNEIFVMSAEGCNPVNLTRHPLPDYGPTWSPDGTKIAFVTNRDHSDPVEPELGTTEIYVMNADGTGQTRLTKHDGVHLFPAWSPDGTRIAFGFVPLFGDAGQVEIYVMNADGTGLTRLTNNTASDLNPAWSPDSSRIVFERSLTPNEAGTQEIYVMNADGTNTVRLTNNTVSDLDPTYSPDGSKIAFSRASGNSGSVSFNIHVMNADGSNPTPLTTAQGFELEAAWQPLPTAPPPPTPAPTPTPSGYVTLTFNELPTQPAGCVAIEGVSFEFQQPANSFGVFYGNFGPSVTFLQGRALEGDAAGALVMRFAAPTSFLRFGVAHNIGTALSPGFTVQLFDAASNSLGVFPVNTQPRPAFFSEGQFAYAGAPVSRAVVTFSTAGLRFGPPRFALDNLTFDRSSAQRASTVQFTAANYAANESAASASLVIRRTGDTTSPATVEYATLDNAFPIRCDERVGSAFARCDYATTVDTVRFDAGVEEKTVTVPLIDDAHVEDAESVFVQLTGATGNAALGAQSTATVTVTSDDAAGAANPINGNQFFVRQQYLDFLSREPEQGEPWTNVLNNCPNPFNTDPASPSAQCDRNLVSSAFFRSPEFQLKGYYVFLFYVASLGRGPSYEEIIPDMRRVTGQTPEEVFAKRAAFADAWVTRPQFVARYGQLSNSAYIDALLGRYNLSSINTPDPASPDGTQYVTLTRNDLVGRLDAATLTRAQALRALVQSREVDAREYNGAFVAMQYFGYLRRTPEAEGYTAWLDYLNAHPADFRTMIDGFMNSVEYRLRFGQP